MARWGAVAAVGETIAGVLHDASRARPGGEFENSQFALASARELQKSPPADGASVYLYRVEVACPGRNRAPRVGPDGRRVRPSLFIDLHYALSVWADSAARQHRLLGWCMRTLDAANVLTSGVLNHYPPERDVFGPAETVELIPEPLSLQDLVNVWEPLKPVFPLSVGYVARTVALDSTETIPDGPPVLVRELDYGLAEPAT